MRNMVLELTSYTFFASIINEARYEFSNNLRCVGNYSLKITEANNSVHISLWIKTSAQFEVIFCPFIQQLIKVQSTLNTRDFRLQGTISNGPNDFQ